MNRLLLLLGVLIIAICIFANSDKLPSPHAKAVHRSAEALMANKD
jgi:hypothetical protein